MKLNLTSTANAILFLTLAAATLSPRTSAFGQCPCGTVIIQEPQSQTILEGETASFTVIYSDSTSTNPPITSCQWVFNSTNYTGPGVVTLTSNSCTLSITNVSQECAGVYYSVACNPSCCGVFGSCPIFSNNAFLAVVPLRIDSVSLTGPAQDQFVLSFMALANRSYSVLFRPGADAGAWSNAVSIAAQPATGEVSVTNPIPAGAMSGFFRLVSPSQP